jgi:MinD-like ATPase involved in chromosome partitioning or flagellar assembly
MVPGHFLKWRGAVANHSLFSSSMTDQADKLRTLRGTALDAAHTEPGTLPLIVVSGARPGVGATTAAINLACVLADRGERVLVVDASKQPNNLRGVAGIRDAAATALADVLANRSELMDSVVAGPLGISVIAGSGGTRSRQAAAKDFAATLLTMLAQISDRFDVILLDAGSGLGQATRRFWRRSPLALLVTTADDASVMDAYAMVKLCVADGIRPGIGLLLNRAECESAAVNAQHRIVNSCRKFLSLDVQVLPPLSQYRADFAGQPRVWEDPNSQFGHEALWLGRAVSDLLAAKLASGSWHVGSRAEGRKAHAVS